jgi:hypothetical protein
MENDGSFDVNMTDMNTTPPVALPGENQQTMDTEAQAHARFRAHRAGSNTAAPLPQRDERHWMATRPREAAISYVTEFFSRLLGVTPDTITRITDPTVSFYQGDLRLPNSRTAEVKARPIDPNRYPLTRIEIASLTFDPRHIGGAAQLAHMMNLDALTLADVVINDFTKPAQETHKFGSPDYISVMINSNLGSAVTVFANPANHNIYIYTREEIMGHIRRGLLAGSCRRGEYPDQPDTLTLLIPLPRWRYAKDRHGMWRYTGIGVAETEKRALRQLLSAVQTY